MKYCKSLVSRIGSNAVLCAALAGAGMMGCSDDDSTEATDDSEDDADEDDADEDDADEDDADEDDADEDDADEDDADEDDADAGVPDLEDGGTSESDAGDDDAEDPGTDQEPETSWIVGAWIETTDAWYGVMGVVDDLTSDNELDLDDVVSFDGDFTFTQYEGGVLVGHQGQPIIEKWIVNDEGRLEQDGDITFLALGVQETHGASHNVIQVIDEDTAWFFDHPNGRAIVFDPSDMTTSGETIDYFEIYDGLDLEADWPDIGDVGRVGDHIAVPMFWYSGADDTIPVETRIALLDTTNDEVTIATDTRCAGSSVMSNDSDGNLYFGPHAAAALYSAAGDAGDMVPCIIRILSGETEVDQDYLVNLNELNDGKAVTGPYTGPGNMGLFFQFDGDPSLGARARFVDEWSLRSIELGAEAPDFDQIDGWPSGHGVAEAFSVVVGTETKYYMTSTTEGGAASAYYEILPDGSVEEALNFPTYPGIAVNY